MDCEKSLAAIENEDEAKKNIEQQAEVNEDCEIREEQEAGKRRQLDSYSESDISETDDSLRLNASSIRFKPTAAKFVSGYNEEDLLLAQSCHAKHSVREGTGVRRRSTSAVLLTSIASKGASAVMLQDGGDTSGTSTTAEQGLDLARLNSQSMLSLYSSAGSELVSARSHAEAAAADASTEPAGDGDDVRTCGAQEGASLARAGSLRSMEADDKTPWEEDARRSALRSSSSRSEGVSDDGSGESGSEYNDAAGWKGTLAGGEHGPTRLVRVYSSFHAGRRDADVDYCGQDDDSGGEVPGDTQAGGPQEMQLRQSLAVLSGKVEGRVRGPGMVAGMLKSMLKSSMQASFKDLKSAPSAESVGTVSEAATFEDLMNRKTRENLAWYFHPAVYRASLSIVLVRLPAKCRSTAICQCHSCLFTANDTMSMPPTHSAPYCSAFCFFGSDIIVF
jgi:hypothetical protein